MPTVAELQEEYSTLRQRYHRLQQKIKWRGKCPRNVQLRGQLSRGKRLLRRSLCSAPFHQDRFGPYRHTYAILERRITLLIEHFTESLTMPPLTEQSPPGDKEAWLDRCDDLEDRVEQYDHAFHQQQRTDRLLVIELLDALDRTDPTRADMPSAVATAKLQKALHILRRAARKYLFHAGVNRVQIQVGAYPDVETTRILNDGQQQFDDAIVISEIVEQGYLWKTVPLRRAAVAVVTQTP